jgi:hypothetical protein
MINLVGCFKVKFYNQNISNVIKIQKKKDQFY